MKEYKRHIIEFFLVFFSVFAAFLFENYRVELEEEGNYLNSLQDFQVDLQKNISNLKFEIDANATSTSGYRNLFQNKYDELLKLSIAGKTDEFMSKFLIYFKLQQVPPVEWIFPSVQYNKLMSDYFEHIKTKELKNYLAQYQRRFLQREYIRSNELKSWEKIVDHIDMNYNIVPKSDDFYNSKTPDSIHYDYQQDFFKFINSAKNKRQFKLDYDRMTNMTYSLKRLNELAIFNNRTKIEEFSHLDSLIERELELW